MEVCSHNGFDPNTVLLKINGTRCNLNCKYCSEIRKSHKNSMNYEECKNIISKLPTSCDILLHGGEPLLDYHTVNAVISAFRMKKTGNRLSIQTNGYINSNMKQLLLDNNDILKIGISIDGYDEQNSLRVDHQYHSVFQQVDETISFFEQHGIQIKCIATVNSINVHNPIGTLEYFLSHKNINQIKFNPCFDVDGGGLATYSIRPLQFFNYISKIIEYWIVHRVYKTVRIDPIQAEFEAILKPETHLHINCCKFISIYPEGQATICDALGIEAFEPVEVSKIFVDAKQRFHDILVSPCENCKEFLNCGGGCIAIFRRFDGMKDLTQEYCDYRMKLKQYLRSIMQEILKME